MSATEVVIRVGGIVRHLSRNQGQADRLDPA